MLMRSPLAQYITVTASYWAFTLTDGALRMLVLLFYPPLFVLVVYSRPQHRSVSVAKFCKLLSLDRCVLRTPLVCLVRHTCSS